MSYKMQLLKSRTPSTERLVSKDVNGGLPTITQESLRDTLRFVSQKTTHGSAFATSHQKLVDRASKEDSFKPESSMQDAWDALMYTHTLSTITCNRPDPLSVQDSYHHVQSRKKEGDGQGSVVSIIGQNPSNGVLLRNFVV